MDDVAASCARCGSSDFPVKAMVEGVRLCGDCRRWVGQGAVTSVAAEMVHWAVPAPLQHVVLLHALCAADYTAFVKQRAAERREKAAKDKARLEAKP